MANPRRQIFRASAMQQYIQRREQDILPQIISPPVFACSWFLLALILMAALLAWSAQLPTYISASGVITQQTGSSSTTQAVVFFPSADASQLRAGQPVKLTIGSNTSVTSTITRMQTGIISPADARKQYGLDASEAQVVTEPSSVVIVNLDKSFSAHTFAGSIISAQVQVGTHSILSQIA